MTTIRHRFQVPALAIAWFLVLGACLLSSNGFASSPVTNAPVSPRDFYNDGTQKFRDGKLTEAETALQTAVATQNEKIQPPALYNLGEVRFQQGAKLLKDGPKVAETQARSQQASENGTGAIQDVNDALSGNDIQQMVAAYMHGRGSRKELKAAVEAVKRAMESNASVLNKWQRSSGDFKSADELRQDADAHANAEIVDRYIAKLVDLQQMMMRMMAGMSQQRQELGAKMKKLKEKMPGDPGRMFKGGDEDDDDDEDKPKPEPKEGQQEGPTKNGKERQLTLEEAEELLGMLRLDTNRKLPLGMTDTAKPKDRNHRDW
ncbi:MAG TPA: hypothetical protein VN281_03640 [Verrucomicrobiae bacterium]|nr:hypothetical protein [Verrucomicrobiae bacterium]